MDCCYRHDSHLFTGSSDACDQVITSSRGVQQGDPLGPSLFALAVHSAVQEVRRDIGQAFPSGLDICAFYLDDGLCAGSAPAVSFFLSSLTNGLSRIGLVVNLSKTEVIPACTASQNFGPSNFPGCTWNGSASFKLLGAAIGPRTGVRPSSAAALTRPVLSSMPSVAFQMLRAPFAFSGPVLGGLRFCIPAPRCLAYCHSCLPRHPYPLTSLPNLYEAPPAHANLGCRLCPQPLRRDPRPLL